MTPARRLVYDFLALPHHVQFAIGKEMGLSAPLPDEADVEIFKRWFGEATAAGRIEELRLKVGAR